MNPLTIHPGAAGQLLQGMLIAWAVIEILLRLRNLGGRTALDWTFGLVVASVVLAINAGFRRRTGSPRSSAAAGPRLPSASACWRPEWPSGSGRS